MLNLERNNSEMPHSLFLDFGRDRRNEYEETTNWLDGFASVFGANSFDANSNC